jgi:hypothetical protein
MVWVMVVCGFWPVPCGQLAWTFHDNWPHRTSQGPHMTITQNTSWVAYQALTILWGWQPYAETCRDRKIWNVLIKNRLLPWASVGLFTDSITRCSVQPSRSNNFCLFYQDFHFDCCIRHPLSTALPGGDFNVIITHFVAFHIRNTRGSEPYQKINLAWQWLKNLALTLPGSGSEWSAFLPSICSGMVVTRICDYTVFPISSHRARQLDCIVGCIRGDISQQLQCSTHTHTKNTL